MAVNIHIRTNDSGNVLTKWKVKPISESGADLVLIVKGTDRADAEKSAKLHWKTYKQNPHILSVEPTEPGWSMRL